MAKLLACGFGVPFVLHLNDFAWGVNWTAVAVLGSKVQQSDVASQDQKKQREGQHLG